MTEAQGTELIELAQQLWLVVRLVFIVQCLSFGAMIFQAYKSGRSSP